jgi:hypothetical protein
VVKVHGAVMEMGGAAATSPAATAAPATSREVRMGLIMVGVGRLGLRWGEREDADRKGGANRKTVPRRS